MQRCPQQDLNLQPTDHKSKCLTHYTTAPPVLHQLDHMQIVCTSLQTDNHASTSSFNFLQARCLFLTPNQQSQITEGKSKTKAV